MKGNKHSSFSQWAQGGDDSIGNPADLDPWVGSPPWLWIPGRAT